MPDLQIQKDFIEGVHEIYETLFTNGVDDGVYYYSYKPNSSNSIYREEKFKIFNEPILLIAKVQLVPEVSENNIEEIKNIAKFVIPRKSLTDNNIPIANNNDVAYLRKGYMRYKDTFYEILNVKPSVFVEDVFLIFTFECVEDIHTTSITVVPSPPEGDANVQP